MLIIDQIRISILETNPKAALGREAARILHIPPHKIRQLRIRKRSIDARKKPDIFLLYSVSVEVDGEKTLWRSVRKNRNVRQDNDLRYRILSRRISFEKRPVVVGFGPAGMFASYILALSGANPIVVERGRAAEERKKDVERFFETGNLLPESNVQFGEGGAGTFSDGKLVTQKNDRFGRNRFVLETFHKFGADESVLYDAKPHIGTDKLVEIVSAMRREIERLGGTVYFETRMESLLIEGGCVKGVVLSDGTTLESDHVLLGIGHSARDTFAQLFSQGVPMQAKPFAVGFRVEHPQERISRMQYGKKAAGLLPPAPYKLVVKSERPLYSFCMCPGGFVVNASSEPG
ncbi:MAG: FAD-dependent oxidoreductase, partial [Lachnospiraceae bacterium]|nr:FAD-dependent oxidoreductase [Lachnospiraceae bacterium]